MIDTDLQFLAVYRVRFTPRAAYRGRPLRASLLPFAGRVLVVQTWWMMGDDDRYPGEWALGQPVGTPARLGLDVFGRPMAAAEGLSLSQAAEVCTHWIASGDVEVLEQVSDGISDMMARG